MAAAKSRGKKARTAARRGSAPARATAKDAAASGRYVYGIVRASEPVRIGPLGLGPKPAPVRMVSHRGLAAVVSDVEPAGLDPTRENLLAHERVNEAVMRQHTLLPMSFGTVLATDGDVEELLRGAYDALRRHLTRLDGKVEYGVKLVWDRDQLIRQLEQGDPDLKRLREAIQNEQGSSYFARVQYGRLVDQALHETAERATQHLLSRLGEAAEQTRPDKPLGDRVVLNAAFLVARDQETEFDARLAEVAAELPDLTVRVTGPWPPYSFVRLRLHLD